MSHGQNFRVLGDLARSFLMCYQALDKAVILAGRMAGSAP